MAKELHCTSCRIKVSNQAGSVRFKCPACGKEDVLRCPHCRKIAAKYKCEPCGFVGP